MPRSGNTRRRPAEQVSNAEDTLRTVEEVLTRAQELIGAETQSGNKSANYYTNAPYFRAHACRDLPEARKALGVLCLWHFRESPPQEKLRWAIEGREWLEPLSNDFYVKKWLVEFEFYSTPNTAGHPPHNDLLTDSNDDDGMGADALINKKLKELWNLLAEPGVPEGERVGWVAERMGELFPASQHQVAAVETTRSTKAVKKARPELTIARLKAAYDILLRESDLANPSLSEDDRMRQAIHLRQTYDRLRSRDPNFHDDSEQLRLARNLLNRRAYHRRKTAGSAANP